MYACKRMLTFPSLVSIPPYSAISAIACAMVKESTHLHVTWRCFHELFQFVDLVFAYLYLIKLETVSFSMIEAVQ